MVGEVLAAFVREHSPTPRSSPPLRQRGSRLFGRRSRRSGDIDRTTHTPPPATVKAALTVLGRRPLNDRSYRPADLTGSGLTGVHLPGANLRSAAMQHVDLYGAFLTGANLEHADLRLADLSLAVLHEARLVGAELNGATLRAADLYGADLTGAILHDADLTDANLTNADLTGVKLFGAKLDHVYGADLAAADFTSPFTAPDEGGSPDEKEGPGHWVRIR
jgi:hypothetical protein